MLCLSHSPWFTMTLDMYTWKLMYYTVVGLVSFGHFLSVSGSVQTCIFMCIYVYINVNWKNWLHNILSISLPPPPLPCLSILTLSSNHPSGRNLVSKYEELMWSSPLLGLMSFWLCPSSRCSTVLQSWCCAYRWALG